MTKPRRRVKRYAAMHKEALESRIRAEREANLRDIAEELATALRTLVGRCQPPALESERITRAPTLREVDAARTVLRRYDDSRKEHGNGD